MDDEDQQPIRHMGLVGVVATILSFIAGTAYVVPLLLESENGLLEVVIAWIAAAVLLFLIAATIGQALGFLVHSFVAAWRDGEW
jgi:ABC-type siderophore export system fused ATPase/permease subunit